MAITCEEYKPVVSGIVRTCYDHQRLRMQCGLRVVAAFKKRLGFEPGKKEDENEDSDAQEIMRRLKRSHALITNAVADKTVTPKNFSGDETIQTFGDFALAANYFALLHAEKTSFKNLERFLESAGIKVYDEWLKFVPGVGPALAGVLLSEFDITKAKYASSFWMYAGLDVAADGRGRGRWKEHLVDREYVDAKGETKTKKGLTYNAFLHDKLLGVMGASFLRVKESPYKEVYYNYKNRLENRADIRKAQTEFERDKKAGKKVFNPYPKARIHKMAIRYMINRFLADLYTVWRECEGLEVFAPYPEAKLGYVHEGKHTLTGMQEIISAKVSSDKKAA